MMNWARWILPIMATVVASVGHAETKNESFELAVDGKTNAVIVKPEAASPIDEYAVRELAHYLDEITGADFAVVEPDASPKAGKRLFVGMSAPMRKSLGMEDPMGKLKDQEHVVRVGEGGDVFLYGKGKHGNLNAVFEFLEDPMGWRWYSLFEHPVVPSRPTVVLKPFNRKMGFDFAYRDVSRYRSSDFRLQHGVNQGFDARKRKSAWRHGPACLKRITHLQSKTPVVGAGHSLHLYLPPKGKKQDHYDFTWQHKESYFETHPEYFSLLTYGKWNTFGRRTLKKQVCLTNPEARAELTRNILRHIELAGGGDKEMIIKLGANDAGGHFCHCPACRQLEESYQTPGGPMIDYWFEICDAVKKKYPKVKILSLAYRREQTLHPPKLPGSEMLPDNLIIDFAPSQDNYFADWWNHRAPETQEFYEALLGWRKIAHHLWAWIYPNPWRTGAVMPVGNIERLINNVRLMKYAGVEGIFADHNGFNDRSGFSELQNYLLLKMLKDVNVDVDALVEEFTDHMFAAAAPLMREYMGELEDCRIAMKDLPPGVKYKSLNYDNRTFPYLTPENIHRWQSYFDEMEKITRNAPKRVKNNIRYVRRELDFATLWKWCDLVQKYPNHYRNHKVVTDRIAAINKARPEPWMNDFHSNRNKWEKESEKEINRKAKPIGENEMRNFLTLIKLAETEKPLPKEFDGIDRTLIHTFPPVDHTYGGLSTVNDPDAAWGCAVPVHRPDVPFHFGFHSNDSATRNPGTLRKLPPNCPAKWEKTLKGTYALKREIRNDEITPGKYTVYKLGEIDVTPDSVIWFSDKSWRTKTSLGDRFFQKDDSNRWEAYASLKFDGEKYGGEGKALVLCDRIIFVRRDDEK